MPVLPKRVWSGSLSTFPIGPLHVASLSSAVDEFRGRYGGEWRLVPRERQATGQSINIGNGVFRTPTYPRLADLNTSEGRYGSDRSPFVVFEFGTTRSNVASYTFNVDRQQMANRIYVPRVGFPEPGRTGTTALIISDEATAMAAMARMYDAWVDPEDIQLTAQRQALADFHKNLRSGPRRVVQLTPAVNAEIQPWVDYDLGDFVRFKAFEGDTLRLDVIVRIYGITATIDNQGNESVTVTTSEEATS
jgi:hypothetical protein